MAEDFGFLIFNGGLGTISRDIRLACLHRLFGRTDEHDG